MRCRWRGKSDKLEAPSRLKEITVSSVLCFFAYFFRLPKCGLRLFGGVLLAFASLNSALAYQNYSLQTAAQQYEQIVRAIPGSGSPTPLLRQAQQAVDQGRWSDAVDRYQRALALDPNSAHRWLRLANAWNNLVPRTQETRERSRQAAFLAFRKAPDPERQQEALALLGELFVDDQPDETLKIWEQALKRHTTETLAQRYAQLKATRAFRFVQSQVYTDTSRPEICLTFSETVSKRRDLQLADYVRVEPNTGFSFTARDERLCIEGVDFATRYQITVLEGLPSQNAHTLAQTVNFAFDVENRPLTLAFKGNGIVLPRQGRQGLPLVSVNVTQAQIEVLQINDRNFLNALNVDYWTVLDNYRIREIVKNHGTRVATARLSIDSVPNQETTTLVPLGELITSLQTGLYIVTARDALREDKDWIDHATQWLVVSDLGLTTIHGQDGLHVFVRSLETGRPVPATLRLLARNNAVLQDLETDQQGYARLDPGVLRGLDSQQARMLLAYAGESQAVSAALRGQSQGVDFVFLDLSRPAFDFSDRGVIGREAPSAVDAYLYTERGIYRPGETVQLTALLRDPQANAVESPLVLQLVRGDDTVMQSWSLSPQAALQGAYTVPMSLPPNARLGSYSVRAFIDPTLPEIGRVAFQVEDFVPQQIKVTLDTANPLLYPHQPATVAVNSAFLYGAPAAHLNAEAKWELRAVTNPFRHLEHHPFGDLSTYQFGLVEESFDTIRGELDLTATDHEGNAQLEVLLDETPDISLPLAATIRVGVFEPGGRPVHMTKTLPYGLRNTHLGVKSRFGEQLGLQQSGQLEVIALDEQGQPLSLDAVRYQLYREDYQYIWFQRQGTWGYETLIRDSAPLVVASKALSASSPTVIEIPPLDWGYYRAEVFDPISEAATSVRFRVGWTTVPATDERPDQLQVTLDQPHYGAGETAQLFVKAPFAGEVLVTVLSNRLWHQETHTLGTDGLTLTLPVDANWGPGVYVTAVAYRPADDTQGPNRAIGLTWLAFDTAPRTLNVQLDLPEAWLPRQTVLVPITVDNPSQEPLSLTVAAVDEGILQITDFKTPNPTSHYFAKRRLGVDWRDLYGLLIRPEGREGRLRFGGDAASRNLNPVGESTVQTVALFSGPITLDEQGRGTVELALPDFNGELRFMAVAWSPTRLGHVEQAVKVRDPVIAKLYTPRFMAPNDRADLTLQLDNLGEPMGDYTATWETRGAIRLATGATSSTQLTRDDRRRLETVPIVATAVGSGELILRVTGPDLDLQRTQTLSVRPTQPITTRRRVRQLAANGSLELGPEPLRTFLSGTGLVQLSVAMRPPLNIGQLLQQLDRYPYGCLEQTVSRALPLLVGLTLETPPLMSTQTGLPSSQNTDPKLAMRVQNAIGRLLAMQRFEGDFGLWNTETQASDWLNIYTTDFLWEAKLAGYFVPDEALTRALKFVDGRQRSQDFSIDSMPQRAFAALVLAKANRIFAGDLRYLFDVHGEKLTPLGAAQLGMALALYNDTARSQLAFAQAVDRLKGGNIYGADAVAGGAYASELRDLAAVTALLLDAQTHPSGLSVALEDELPPLIDRLIQHYQGQRFTNTQEQAWLLRAAKAMNRGAKPLNLVVNGQAITDIGQYQLDANHERLVEGISLANQGDSAVWLALTESGVPVVDQPAESHGFVVERAFFQRDGTPIALDTVSQNDLLVVQLKGAATTGQRHEALIVDLLPAGFEIENSQLVQDPTYAWLGKRSWVEFAEGRDDRFVAAVNLSREQPNFSVAYLVRAVTRGDFQLPAPYVEDMYRPDQFARGETAQVVVK